MAHDMNPAQATPPGPGARAAHEVHGEANGEQAHPAREARPASAEKHPAAEAGGHRGGGGVGTVLISVVLSVVAGGAGAWAYEKYVAPQAEPASAQQPAAQPSQSAPAPAVDTSKLASADAVKETNRQVENVSNRLDKLQERFGSLPRYEPAADVSELKNELSDLAKNHDAYKALPNRVSALAERVGAVERDLAALRTDVTALRAQTKRTTGPGSASVSTASRTDVGTADSEERALAEGANLFQQGLYMDAADVFSKLERAHPEDARVWYFAALANGMASGNWRDETERLVQKGLEREKAGTPSAAKIDSTFAGLTQANGKSWLAAIRKRAAH